MELWIAESGGTKTDWLGLDRCKPPKLFSSSGLNPNVIGWEKVREQLAELAHQVEVSDRGHLFFYGAGLAAKSQQEQMTLELRQHFGSSATFQASSDLQAAALAGLGNRPGVVGILGTGSVAIRFDGAAITNRFGGLGYLLGDEGGGSQLGQTFLRALLAKALDGDLLEAHQEFFHSQPKNWAQQVYSAPNPVPVFTSQIPFISKFRHHPQIEILLKDQFELFFRNTLLPSIATPTDHVVLLGGIAREFHDLILRWARNYHLKPHIDFQRPVLPLAKTLIASFGQGQTFNTAGIFDGSSETCPHPG